jgi:IS605 OrfB family transposase
MLTLKLKYISNNQQYINKFNYQYTGAFYKIYNNPELASDTNFINNILSNTQLDKSFYDNCLEDVKTKLTQYQTILKKRVNKINEIEKILNNNEFITKKEKRYKFKLIKKFRILKRNLNKNITFGGKTLLRNITKLSQKRDKVQEDLDKLNKYKEEFKNKRVLGLYSIGRACEGGNRKFNFSLLNEGKIIFKPNRDNHIEISINQKGKQKDVINILHTLCKENLIPITVRLSNEFIYISYDEELINGYSFNNVECKKEQSKVIDKEEKKNIYIKYKKEQNNRKLKGKISYRYMGIDLNPNNIGLSIVDKLNDNVDGDFKIIHKECIDLSGLNKKLNLSSNSDKQKKQNNKRKHEIKEVWKHIFKLCVHYKVSHFVMEDLSIKDKGVNNDNKKANRLVKNIWNLELTKQLIDKWCNILGIIKLEVNCAYSSLIGNTIFDDYDPVASSLEIVRRGIVKYIKGNSIFPSIRRINQEKLNYLLGENISIDGLTWKRVYELLTLLRYRNLDQKSKLKEINLYSLKSNVKVLQ